jgi:hypothetical protein
MHRRLAPAIDFFVREQELVPHARSQLRFLVSCLMLGATVAIAASAFTFTIGAVFQSAVILAFAIACAGLLIAARSRVDVRRLWMLSLALLGCFLSVQCMQTARLDGGTLKWFALLPLVLLLYLDGSGVRASDTRRDGAIWSGAAMAIGFAVLVTLAHLEGWAAHLRPATPAEAPWIEQLVDFVFFTLSVAGLLSSHRLAVRRLEEELGALRSMLRVCAWCRRIHDDDEGWVMMERYMLRHSNHDTTHGICPECERKAHAEIDG